MVMSIRTIADIDQSQQLDYHAVRNEKKLKEMIMTDLMTSYIFKTVSLDYHGRSCSDCDMAIEFMRIISRQILFHYHGDNIGTPANQISKRVNNILSFLSEKSPSEEGGCSGDPLKTEGLTDRQRSFIRSFYSASDNNGSISIRVTAPLNEVFDGRSHVKLDELVHWIINDLIMQSREIRELQCIIFVQDNLLDDILGDIKGVSDTVKLKCIRMYLALRCALSRDMQGVGKVYELVFDSSSLYELLPIPQRHQIMDKINILFDSQNWDVTDAISKVLVENGMEVNSERCSQDRMDLAIRLYMLRLRSGYQIGHLLIALDVVNDGTIDAIRSTLDIMKWDVGTILVLTSDVSRVRATHPDVVFIDSGKEDTDIVADLLLFQSKGVTADGHFMTLMKGVMKDILKMGYPAMDDALIDGAQSYASLMHYYRDVLTGQPMKTSYGCFVYAVRDYIIGLDEKGEYGHVVWR